MFQHMATIGDINNNGKLDIVVSCEGTLNLYAIEPDSSGEISTGVTEGKLKTSSIHTASQISMRTSMDYQIPRRVLLAQIQRPVIRTAIPYRMHGNTITVSTIWIPQFRYVNSILSITT